MSINARHLTYLVVSEVSVTKSDHWPIVPIVHTAEAECAYW